MDRIKKMYLVDKRQLDKLTTPKDRVLYNIEDGMDSILADDSISDDRKAKLYSSAQSRYLAMDAPEPVKRAPEPFNVPTDVLDAMPKALKPKANRLINNLKNNKRVTFNSREELVVDGVTIPNSNATNLFNDALRKRAKNAVGYDEFEKVLLESNIPSDIIVRDTPAVSAKRSATVASPPPAASYISPPNSPVSSFSAPAKRKSKKKIKWVAW
jgi:uncharacterized protein YbaR (Trm112 family)